MFTRYAIYYTPPPGLLADFGAAWLGWDVACGRSVRHPSVDGLDVAALTDTTRKYGFHGTIKPPFRLADGVDERGLQTAFEAFCADHAPTHVDALELVALGRFLALVPVGDASELGALAGQAVQQLDLFRASQSQIELDRRRGNLTPAQERNLCDWGYPYVLDTFRFHMTLSRKVAKAELAQAMDALKPLLEPLLPKPFVIDALTLVGERSDGMFVEINRKTLTG